MVIFQSVAVNMKNRRQRAVRTVLWFMIHLVCEPQLSGDASVTAPEHVGQDVSGGGGIEGDVAGL